MKEIVFTISLCWLAYTLTKGKDVKNLMQNKPQNIPNNLPSNAPSNAPQNVKKHVAVNNNNGAMLYASTGNTALPEYGKGRNPITKVGNRVYLGMVTGRQENNMLEVSTLINTATVKFWVHTKDIVLLTKKQYEICKADSNIIDKKEETKLKLLQNS